MKKEVQLPPDDPLNFIQSKVRDSKIYWTYHVNMRLSQRRTTKSMLIGGIDSFELIESYQSDKYLPSYLVWGSCNKVIFHVVFAVDLKMDNVRVVTAYFPDSVKWKNNFKLRKKT